MPKNEMMLVDRSQQNALSGPIPDLMEAFKQVAANISTLALNGWNNYQKAMAACWLAHGAGMHPATYILNHYVMEGKNGNLVVEPKWQFMVGVLQSRLGPGFKFEVLQEKDDLAEVRMSYGQNTHTVSYSLADAKRQGLLGRKNAWTEGNTREMCLIKATKRCAPRIGAAALLDLPFSDNLEFEVDADSQPSPTAAIDSAVAKAAEATTPKKDTAPIDVNFTEAPPPVDQRQRMVSLITEYLKPLRMTKALLAEKVNYYFNESTKELTGVDPNVSFQKGEVGPDEAKQIADYIEKKIAGAAGDSDSPARPVGGDEAPAVPSEEDEPPAAEEEEEAPPPERTKVEAYNDLMDTVARARKLFGRKYVQDPKAPGVFWYTDKLTYEQAGFPGPVLIQKGPEVEASVRDLDQLNKVLSAACDTKERGAR